MKSCAFKSLFKYEINIKHNKFLFFNKKKANKHLRCFLQRVIRVIIDT